LLELGPGWLVRDTLELHGAFIACGPATQYKCRARRRTEIPGLPRRRERVEDDLKRIRDGDAN